MDPAELADSVLERLVAIHRRRPNGRFTLTRSIDKRGLYRVTHPGGKLNTDLSVIDKLVSRKVVTVTVFEPGYEVLEITPDGFKYADRLQWLHYGSRR